jgi:hypothetical protein
MYSRLGWLRQAVITPGTHVFTLWLMHALKGMAIIAQAARGRRASRSDTRVAVPGLLAHAEVTKTFSFVPKLRYPAVWAQVVGCCSRLRRRRLLSLQLSSLGMCLLSNAMGCKCMLLCMCVLCCSGLLSSARWRSKQSATLPPPPQAGGRL